MAIDAVSTSSATTGALAMLMSTGEQLAFVYYQF